MTDFASLPPSHKTPEPDGFFQGGMMPATGQDLTALIILDLRNLGLSSVQGRELEAEIREFVHQRLEKMDVNLKNRSAIDLSKSVFGISFD
jgi:hypothetical protein